MTNGSPWPAFAMPSMRWRLTELPMPNEKTFASPRWLRTWSNIAVSSAM